MSHEPLRTEPPRQRSRGLVSATTLPVPPLVPAPGLRLCLETQTRPQPPAFGGPGRDSQLHLFSGTLYAGATLADFPVALAPGKPTYAGLTVHLAHNASALAWTGQ